MNREDAEEFTTALGQIATGAGRHIALGIKLGVPSALGLEPGEWIRLRLAGVRLSIEERREAVAELHAEGMTQGRIAGIVGVDQSTVSDDLHGGRTRPPMDGSISAPLSEDADQGRSESDYGSSIPRKGSRKPADTGETQWYTPPKIIEPARQAMGGIDLDPASTPEANTLIKAKRIWTESDNGLKRPWSGRVWLNPPYGTVLVSKFGRKLLESLDSGDVKQACMLVNNSTDSDWFQMLALEANAMALLDGRVRFWYPGKGETNPTQGQIVLYFGNRVTAFMNAFDNESLGIVVGRL